MVNKKTAVSKLRNCRLNKIKLYYACGSLDSTFATTVAGAFTLTTGDFLAELLTLTTVGFVGFTTTALDTFATLTSFGLLSLATVFLSDSISLLISAGLDTTTVETVSEDLAAVTFFANLGVLEGFDFFETDCLILVLTSEEFVFDSIIGFASTERFEYFAPGFGPRFFDESFAVKSLVDDSTETGLLFSSFGNLALGVLETRDFLVAVFLYFVPGFGPRFLGVS